MRLCLALQIEAGRGVGPAVETAPEGAAAPQSPPARAEVGPAVSTMVERLSPRRRTSWPKAPRRGFNRRPGWAVHSAWKHLAPILGLALALLVAGCGTDAAARVNGEVITRTEVQWAERELATFAAAQGTVLPPPRRRTIVLNNLIATRLIRQQARRDGLTVGRAEVDARLVDLVQEAGGRDRFLASLQTTDLTVVALRQQVEDELLAARLVERHFAALPPGEARWRAFSGYLETLRQQATIEVFVDVAGVTTP